MVIIICNRVNSHICGFLWSLVFSHNSLFGVSENPLFGGSCSPNTSPHPSISTRIRTLHLDENTHNRWVKWTWASVFVFCFRFSFSLVSHALCFCFGFPLHCSTLSSFPSPVSCLLRYTVMVHRCFLFCFCLYLYCWLLFWWVFFALFCEIGRAHV